TPGTELFFVSPLPAGGAAARDDCGAAADPPRCRRVGRRPPWRTPLRRLRGLPRDGDTDADTPRRTRAGPARMGRNPVSLSLDPPMGALGRAGRNARMPLRTGRI